MKKWVVLFIAFIILVSCFHNPPEESSDNIIVQSESKESSKSLYEPTEDILFTSVTKDIEFWSKYSENYVICINDWITDDYFFILLENKETKNFRYLFWETATEKLIDLGEHETELFLADHTFYRNGNFYVFSAPDKIMKIKLASFEISYIDANLPNNYREKEFERTLSLSPQGTVAEFKDKYTILLYDILDPNRKKTIDLKEIAPLGMMLNQGIMWSFDGKYFSLFVYEEGKEYHQNSTYSILNSDGEFVRYVTGGDLEVWDNDHAWVWSYGDENKENFYIYSLTEPDSDPAVVYNYFSCTNNFMPRNGIYYYEQSNYEKNECEILMVDSFENLVTPIAKFDFNSFSHMLYPSPNGKYLACIETNSEYFFFKFIEIN